METNVQPPLLLFIDKPPVYMLSLHNLARRGHANIYGGSSRRLVVFDASKGADLYFAKWSPLQTAERVTIIYRDPAEVIR